jgi:aminoglycoside/choline kinase family phosphotransferase
VTSPVSSIERAVGSKWPGSQIHSISALKGDASTRRFWRIAISSRTSTAPAYAIAIDLGPDDLPLYAKALHLLPEPLSEPPWLEMQRFFFDLGLPVPELYASDLSARLLLVEDVGELPLAEAARCGDAADLYRLAADELLRIHLEGTQKLGPACIAARIAYDARLFRWELEQLVEMWPEIISRRSNPSELRGEFDDLADRLGRLPRVLSHRDYHGHNLFLQCRSDGSPWLRVIDFQDALMAPAAQDLAVLLTTRDTSDWISERLEQRVVEYYYAALTRRGKPPMALEEFIESYFLCVLQHALKVIGRFVYLERTGKNQYSSYIPYAMKQARRILMRTNYFPKLQRALME